MSSSSEIRALQSELAHLERLLAVPNAAGSRTWHARDSGAVSVARNPAPTTKWRPNVYHNSTYSTAASFRGPSTTHFQRQPRPRLAAVAPATGANGYSSPSQYSLVKSSTLSANLAATSKVAAPFAGSKTWRKKPAEGTSSTSTSSSSSIATNVTSTVASSTAISSTNKPSMASPAVSAVSRSPATVLTKTKLVRASSKTPATTSSSSAGVNSAGRIVSKHSIRKATTSSSSLPASHSASVKTTPHHRASGVNLDSKFKLTKKGSGTPVSASFTSKEHVVPPKAGQEGAKLNSRFKLSNKVETKNTIASTSSASPFSKLGAPSGTAHDHLIIKFNPKFKLSKKPPTKPVSTESASSAVVSPKTGNNRFRFLSAKAKEIRDKAEHRRSLQRDLLRKRRRISAAAAASRASSHKPSIVHVDGAVYKVQSRKLRKVGHNQSGAKVSASRTAGYSSGTVNAIVKRASTSGASVMAKRKSTPGAPMKRSSPFSKTNKTLGLSATTTTKKKKDGVSPKKPGKKHCLFYSRFGTCAKIDTCPFVHDPSRVAVCTRFLRGTCRVANCPFSHKVAHEKLPVCSFFLRGNCNRVDCPYPHVRVNARAEVCEDFAREGFCANGVNCKKKHVMDCGHKYKVLCKLGKKCLTHGEAKDGKKKVKKKSGGVETSKAKPTTEIPTTTTTESTTEQDSVSKPASSPLREAEMAADTVDVEPKVANDAVNDKPEVCEKASIDEGSSESPGLATTATTTTVTTTKSFVENFIALHPKGDVADVVMNLVRIDEEKAKKKDVTNEFFGRGKGIIPRLSKD